jgi:hypothetical protein
LGGGTASGNGSRISDTVIVKNVSSSEMFNDLR